MIITVDSAIAAGCCEGRVREFAALAREAGGDWLGWVARDAPGLDSAERVALAREAGGDWLGEVARYWGVVA